MKRFTRYLLENYSKPNDNCLEELKLSTKDQLAAKLKKTSEKIAEKLLTLGGKVGEVN